MDNIILAVVGLPGVGKGEASQYIMKKTGWPEIHFGNTVVDEVKARGMEVSQMNERIVREEFRAKHGMGALALINLPRIEELYQKGSVILESFYSWEEYIIVKEKFGDAFKVLAIMANFEIRAQRMERRPERPLSRNALQDRDYVQIDTLHQAGPIARADFVVVNESTTSDLHMQLDGVLNRLV